MKKVVLVIEDEAEISHFIQELLIKEGFDCPVCRDGSQAIQAFLHHQPDVIILDWMLPGMDGLEICTRIRKQSTGKDPYILMLTAKGEELDRVIGLSTGADDYLVKPFSPIELVARIRSLLRRSLRSIEADQVYQTPHFTINIEQHTAQRHEEGQTISLDLSTLEFKLLTAFISSPGRVWTRMQLIDQLWGDDFFGDDRVVDTQVARLRKKVELNPSHPTFIKTVTGVGYKFEDDHD